MHVCQRCIATMLLQLTRGDAVLAVDFVRCLSVHHSKYSIETDELIKPFSPRGFCDLSYTVL